MKLSIIGKICEGRGSAAEQSTLDVISKIYEQYNSLVYVNCQIPGEKLVPDFVVFVENKMHEPALLLIETKSSPVVHNDGSTDYSNVFEQVRRYKKALKNRLKLINVDIPIHTFAILPNAQNIPEALTIKGRDRIYWGNLRSLENWLGSYTPMIKGSVSYTRYVEGTYHFERRLLNVRLCNFEEAQNNIISIKHGGAHKIRGLAGTGKTLVLAQKIFDHIQSGDVNVGLYLTQNKALMMKFASYIQNLFCNNNVTYDVLYKKNDEEDTDIIHKLRYSYNGQIGELHFATYDSFLTTFITRDFDNVLYGKTSWGPLYSEWRRIRDSHNNSNSADMYKEQREMLFEVLEREKQYNVEKFEFYDSLFVDEFQDCRLESSRIKVPLLFVKRTNGIPNVVFTEDSLQSYVKYSEFKKIDDDYQDVKKTDIAGYMELGLKIRGHVHSLDTIYRTPENIFKFAIKNLHETNGLKKGILEKIEKLKFMQPAGKIQTIKPHEFHRCICDELKTRTPSDIIVIGALDSKYTRNDFLFSGTHSFHKVTSQQLARPNKVNVYHEYNVRGLEAPVVYIFMEKLFQENPNFLYTLLCRTQYALVFVTE